MISDKLVFVGTKEYLEMGMTHVGDNRVISRTEAEQVQKTLNQRASAWLKILDMGGKWGHAKRFRETTLNRTANIPPVKSNQGPQTS